MEDLERASTGKPHHPLTLVVFSEHKRNSHENRQVDYQALADAGLYKNARSARVCFDGLKKRLFAADDQASNNPAAANGDGTTKKKAPAAPRKRKAKATAAAEEGVDDEAEMPPSKKNKQTSMEDDADSEDGEV